jgi:DnaK suppressor protein
MKTKPEIPANVDRRWAWHYRTLVGLRERLAADRSELAEEAAAPMEPQDTRSAQCSTDEFDRDLAFTLLQSEENALAEVDAALERLRRGTYGRCEASGRRIPAARLRAIPWCRLTVVEEARREGPARAGSGPARKSVA